MKQPSFYVRIGLVRLQFCTAVMASQAFAALIALLCTSFFAVRAEETNLVLRRGYEYWPLPDYGGLDECKDEDDKVLDKLIHITTPIPRHITARPAALARARQRSLLSSTDSKRQLWGSPT